MLTILALIPCAGMAQAAQHTQKKPGGVDTDPFAYLALNQQDNFHRIDQLLAAGPPTVRRWELLGELATIDIPEARLRLSQAYFDAETLSDRARIGAILWRKGQRLALADLVVAWRSEPLITSRVAGFDDMVDFLVGCGDPAAIAVLAQDIHRRPVEQRASIAVRLGRWTSDLFPLGVAADPEQDRAVKELLTALLRDRAVRNGLTLSVGDVHLTDPSIRELAALALRNRFGPAYGVSHHPGRFHQEQRFDRLRNRMLTELGFPAEPVTVIPQPPSLPLGLSDGLAAAWRAADDSKRQKLMPTLRALGPALTSSLGELDDPDIDRLRQHWSRTVRSVRVTSPKGVHLEIIERVRALAGSELETGTMIRAIRSFADLPEPQVGRLRLAVESEGDGLGLHLHLTLEGAPGRRGYVRFRQHLQLDGHLQIGGSGAGATGYLDPAAQRQLALDSAVDRAVGLVMTYERR